MKQTLGALIAICAFAMIVRAADPKADASADARQITKLEEDWVSAAQKANAAAIDAMLADDFTLVGPSGRVSPKDELVAQFRDGALVIEAAKLADMEVRTYGDAAVCTGILSVTKGHLLDKDMAADYRFTDTYVKRDGKWLKVAQQFTVVR